MKTPTVKSVIQDIEYQEPSISETDLTVLTYEAYEQDYIPITPDNFYIILEGMRRANSR